MTGDNHFKSSIYSCINVPPASSMRLQISANRFRLLTRALAVAPACALCVLANSTRGIAARQQNKPDQAHSLTADERSILRNPYPSSKFLTLLVEKMKVKLADHRFDSLLPNS